MATLEKLNAAIDALTQAAIKEKAEIKAALTEKLAASEAHAKELQAKLDSGEVVTPADVDAILARIGEAKKSVEDISEDAPAAVEEPGKVEPV